MTTTLVLADALRGTTHVMQVRRLHVVGFSGRDTAAVAHHVQELAKTGTPAPDHVPRCTGCTRAWSRSPRCCRSPGPTPPARSSRRWSSPPTGCC